MKHKLKLSFWALGVLVLVISQLFILSPTPRAYAADTLTLDSIQDRTYKYSVYTAWYSCLATLTKVANPLNNDLGNFDLSGGGAVLHVVGFAGDDGNDNDGRATCAETAGLWRNIAGYPDTASMLQDLGFKATPAKSCTTAPAGSTCSDVNTWTLTSAAQAALLNNLTTIAKNKGLPTTTSKPEWERYILAVTALQAKCPPTRTQGSTAPTALPTATVKIVSDNSGTLTSATFSSEDTSKYVPAWPTQTGGGDSTCGYLVNEVQSSSHGAVALSTAMLKDRNTNLVNTAEVAICERLGFSSTAAGHDYRDCIQAFNGYLTSCINTWYEGAKNNDNPTAPFDPAVIAACVKVDADKAGYTISQDDLVSILGSAQSQVTPPASGSNTPTDPCQVLGDDIPMRWLACSLLTAGSGLATTFYNLAQQLLYMPTSSVFTDSFNKTAQSFRLIGMALIIIAGLVMIIAQATGSDLVDAYTIKKVLPKLGIALVGMAVSLPLLRFAVELTNDIGIAAGDVILRLGSPQATGSSAGIDNQIGAIFLSMSALGALGIVWGWAALSFIGTVGLALLIGVLVLAIRQMAIVVLVVLAPLAIAASVLPGTDKLWKFWRSTLLSTLMMFPIIMMFLKAGEFMAGIFSGIADTENNGLFTILAAIIYFAPYFLLPLAFKMAGGLLSTVFGMMNDRGKGLFDRMSKYRTGYGQTHRERTIGRQMLSGRAQMQRDLKKAASRSRTPFGRAVLGGMGRMVGGYNLEAQMSQRQGAVAKEVNDQIATGMDDEIRGLTVNKRAALSSKLDPTKRDGSGNILSADGSWRQKSDGIREFKTLGGAWVSEASVDEGHRRWGRDHFAQQAALSYEMRKANSEEDVERISSGYAALAKDSWNMTETEAGSAWTGAAFENQSQHIEFKKTNWKTGELGSSGYQSLVDEVYEKKGAYPLAQMHSRTIERLKQAYADADNVVATQQFTERDGSTRPATADEIRIAQDRKEKVAGIAETFMHEMGIGGIAGMQGDEPQASTGEPQRRQVGASGSAHLNERVRELADITGVLTVGPTGNYSQARTVSGDPETVHTAVPPVNPAAGTTVPPNQRSQKY